MTNAKRKLCRKTNLYVNVEVLVGAQVRRKTLRELSAVCAACMSMNIAVKCYNDPARLIIKPIKTGGRRKIMQLNYSKSEES